MCNAWEADIMPMVVTSAFRAPGFQNVVVGQKQFLVMDRSKAHRVRDWHDAPHVPGTFGRDDYGGLICSKQGKIRVWLLFLHPYPAVVSGAQFDTLMVDEVHHDTAPPLPFRRDLERSRIERDIVN
jgi:hypothetical protein